MSEINLDIFNQELATAPILENVTRYCTKCYCEFTPNSYIYYHTKNYEYLCPKCAKELSEDTFVNEEADSFASLF